VLFLYRPPQTWMPFSLPRSQMQQAQYNRELQERFASTRRVARAVPTTAERDPVADLERLAELHAAGVLTDAELAAAKVKFVGT
jgi:hypothetical protein